MWKNLKINFIGVEIKMMDSRIENDEIWSECVYFFSPIQMSKDFFIYINCPSFEQDIRSHRWLSDVVTAGWSHRSQ